MRNLIGTFSRTIRNLPHKGNVDQVAINFDGTLVVTGSYFDRDGIVTLWDPRTGRKLRELSSLFDYVTGLAISFDGKRIMTVEESHVRVWDVGPGEHKLSLEADADACAAISSDGKRLVTSVDDTIQIWDVGTAEKRLELSNDEDEVRRVAINFDGNRIAAVYASGGVSIWDGKTGKQLLQLETRDAKVKSVAISSCGTRIVTCNETPSMKSGTAIREKS